MSNVCIRFPITAAAHTIKEVGPVTEVMWFRRDLRLHDNPALLAASESGTVVPLVVLDPALLGRTRPRVAAYLAAVAALDDASTGASSSGRARRERSSRSLCLSRAHGASTSPARRRPMACAGTPGSPPRSRRGNRVARHRIAVCRGGPRPGAHPHRDAVLGFTPFSRAWREHGARPGPRPARLDIAHGLASEPLPARRWRSTPDPVTEDEARTAWRAFLGGKAAAYGRAAGPPAQAGTSPAVHGAQTRHDPSTHPPERPRGARSTDTGGGARFVTELAWREFMPMSCGTTRVGVARPAPGPGDHVVCRSSDPVVAERFSAWREGRTGFPFVDAGMRQLRTEGGCTNLCGW